MKYWAFANVVVFALLLTGVGSLIRMDARRAFLCGAKHDAGARSNWHR